MKEWVCSMIMFFRIEIWKNHPNVVSENFHCESDGVFFFLQNKARIFLKFPLPFSYVTIFFIQNIFITI